MKKKINSIKFFVAVTVLAAAGIVFSACSSGIVSQTGGVTSSMPAAAMPSASQHDKASMEESGFAMAHDSAAMMDGKAEADENAQVTASPQENRKLVKHSGLDLQTKEFDSAVKQITELVTASGGYIENQNIGGRNMMQEEAYQERFGYINARVPAEKLDELVKTVGGICNVLSNSEQVEDISDTYFDAQAHLKSLMLQEERLLEILSKAEKLEEVITLEQSLSETRYKIESLTASLRRMDSQVSYSYLNISLYEVAQYDQVKGMPRTFGDELSLALERSSERLTSNAKYALINIIVDGPTVLIMLAIWLIFIALVIKLIQWIMRRSGIDNAFTRIRLRKSKAKPAEISAPIETQDKQEK